MDNKRPDSQKSSFNPVGFDKPNKHLSSPSLIPEKIKPIRFLLFLIPVALAFFLSFMLKDDQPRYLLWWAALLVFGIGAFPVTAWLFSAFRGKGYGFSKAIGILAVSFVLWTFSYLQLIGFTRFWIIFFLAVLFFVSWGIPKTRKAALSALSSKSDIWEITLEESLFVLALLAWCFIKGLRPEINGEEKFMDFAFLNSLVRTDTLPCVDPWLAGSSINYYYYGQYIYALITKLTGIKTGIAYNLSMCTTFALAFTMSFSLGSLFFDGAIKKGLRASGAFRVAAGILSAFAVTLFGNSHAFFYDENSAGNSLLGLFAKMGINVGRTDGFFYPDSTRFIGHNPDSQIWDEAKTTLLRNGDYTIHEFPCYSYLLGDLHAHVVGLMIVMLIVAVLFSLYVNARHPSGREMLVRVFPNSGNPIRLWTRILYEFKKLLRPEIVIAGILLGIATMCNYWDFLIYFIAGSMTLLIYNIRTSRHFVSLSGMPFFLTEAAMILIAYLKYSKLPFTHVGVQMIIFVICLTGTSLIPCALTRTGLGMSFLFSAASLCSLTFNSKFEMIANSLAKTVDQSSVYQFLILWGTHILFALVLITVTLFSRKTASADNFIEDDYVPENAVARFFAKMNPADIFMSGIAVVSFLLLAAPEIFYVRDIYSGSYKRSNTMFKFTFEAFVLLSLVLAYSFFRFLCIRLKNRRQLYVFAAGALVLALLLFVPMRYPFVAIEQRTGPISLQNYAGLDGTAALKTRDSPQLTSGAGDLADYSAAIDWLNANVEGTPAICEAFGNSYTDNCVISAYTGLPTIIGWQTHEWLWRFQGVVNSAGELVSIPDKDVWKTVLTPRQNDVRAIYTSAGVTEARTLLNKYAVTYLVVGDLERTQFVNINDAVLQNLGTKVFESGTLYIIKIR
ncbi:MAG: DUF2298 domain-containing protein [Eubacteriales bacterium]